MIRIHQKNLGHPSYLSDVSFVPDKQLDSSNFSCDLNESVDNRSPNPLTQFQVSPAGSPVSEYLEQVELSSLSPECLEMTSLLPDCTNNTSSTLSTPNSNLSNKSEGLDPNESIVDIRQIVKNQANGELPNSKFLGIYSVMDVFNPIQALPSQLQHVHLRTVIG